MIPPVFYTYILLNHDFTVYTRMCYRQWTFRKWLHCHLVTSLISISTALCLGYLSDNLTSFRLLYICTPMVYLTMLLVSQSTYNIEWQDDNGIRRKVFGGSCRGIVRDIIPSFVCRDWVRPLKPRIVAVLTEIRTVHSLITSAATSTSAHTCTPLADYSTLKMEAILSSETSVYPSSTQRHIPEDNILFTFYFKYILITAS
jgi:hypothetical protein